MHEPGLSNKRLNTRGGGHKKSDRLRAQWAGRRACPGSLRSLVRACVDGCAPRIPRLVLRASGAGVHDLSARFLQPVQDLVVMKYGFIHFADDTPTRPRSSSAPPGVRGGLSKKTAECKCLILFRACGVPMTWTMMYRAEYARNKDVKAKQRSEGFCSLVLLSLLFL